MAQQILFATTLEEKLRCPEVVTDAHPGSALAAPPAPGRPAELRFRAAGSARGDFPGVHRLGEERERGRVLHFFANHELLATELMALVLLRFPNAPAAFRRGVLNTLREEQEHTRLYLARMKACGVDFGAQPVSGYFWRAVSGMESPLDYVAALSLTFEQANLDFAAHFARGFAAVGDAETAALLEKIYHDEIAHVAYGLKWFRRWKQPGESDWEAFCRQLKFPLSPQRAKGFALNVEARRAAGLEPAFIAALEVFAQSKGRTPGVWVFNPFAEGYIAQGRAFTPVKHQAQLARDLANLPQFLARQDDVVLVPRRPSVEFLSGLKQAGFALPEFVEVEAGTLRPQSQADSPRSARLSTLLELAQRKLGPLRPWAWGPDSVELLAPLFGSVTGEARTAEQRFNPGVARLYEKAWSAEFCRKALALRPGAAWLCTGDETGAAVDSLKEALTVIAAIRRRGHHRIVVKQALGLAGHNAIRLWEPELLETQRRWMARALENGRQLVIEPWLERERDFSVQLEMTARGLQLRGYTLLVNDAKGQYQGNECGPGHPPGLPPSVAASFRGPGKANGPNQIGARTAESARSVSAQSLVIGNNDELADSVVRAPNRFSHSPGACGQFAPLYQDIFALLETELRRVDYLGPIGIDALTYRTASGESRLKPVVEINPRYTMGRLTVELMKQVTPGRWGSLRLVNLAQARAQGAADFPTYARALSERHPIQLAGEPVPKISSGALCLNDPAEAQVCLAVFRVHDLEQRWEASGL